MFKVFCNTIIMYVRLKPPMLSPKKGFRITSVYVTVVVRLATGNVMSAQLLLCINVNLCVSYMYIYSRYINYAVCILSKQVVIANLSADVVRWCTHKCIAYDNLALLYYSLQFTLVQFTCTELQPKCLKCLCILLAHIIFEINIHLMAVDVC